MGYRRFQRGGNRRGMRRRTLWSPGIILNFSEAFAMEAITDVGGGALGSGHAIELVGAGDLPYAGGEGTIVKRILGNVRPLITTQAGTLWQNAAFTIYQQIVKVTRPANSLVLQVARLAPTLLYPHSAGLGSEDIMWTRHLEQPACVDANAFTDLQYLFFTDATTYNAPRKDYWDPKGLSAYDIDVNVSRRLDEDSQVFLVTQAQYWNAPQTAISPDPYIRYDGYIRELLQKAL